MDSEKNLLQILPLELLSQILSYLTGLEVLRFRYLSKYFYYTISNSVISSIRYESSLISVKPQMGFNLNIVSNLSSEVQNDDIRRLSNGDNGAGILGRFENSLDSFISLKELRFCYENILDLNRLAIFSTATPALEVLDIRSCPGLEQKLYTGSKLRNLKSLRIYTYGHNYNQSVSPDDLITSFLESTPKIENVALLGGFFQSDTKTSVNFITKVRGIESFGLEVPQYFNNKCCLPSIDSEDNNLKELFVDAPQISSRQSPQKRELNGLETFYYSGGNCLESLEFYGIGMNLKRLYLKPYGKLDGPDKLTELCRRCVNLEEFGVMFFAAPIEWIVEIAEICEKLRLISFGSLTSNNDSDIQLLSKANNIKDIYLYDRIMSETDVEWLTKRFNIYNGKKKEFDIFVRNPIKDSSWFMWR